MKYAGFAVGAVAHAAFSKQPTTCGPTGLKPCFGFGFPLPDLPLPSLTAAKAASGKLPPQLCGRKPLHWQM